jgi:hypothetical protein
MAALHHAVLPYPGTESPKDGHLVLDGRGRQLAFPELLFPMLGQRFHVFAPKALDITQLVAQIPQRVKAGIEDIRVLVLGGLTGSCSVGVEAVMLYQDLRQTGFPVAGIFGLRVDSGLRFISHEFLPPKYINKTTIIGIND